MAEPETPKQAAEAAAIRRRWITLGELLAVAAVVISGLTFWNSYSERSATEAERAAADAERKAEEEKQATKAQTLLLRSSGGGQRLALVAADSGQTIQSQTILFPAALGVRTIDAVIEPRIESDWVEDAAKAAREAGSRGGGSGDARLPVAITTRFVSDGESYSDTAIYDVGYTIDSSLLGGTDIELLGLSLVERAPAAQAQRRLDSLWKSRMPAKAD